MKKLLAMALIGVMVLGTIACGKKEEKPAETPVVESQEKLSWQEQKEEQARQRKRQNDLKKTEERILEIDINEDKENYLFSVLCLLPTLKARHRDNPCKDLSYRRKDTDPHCLFFQW